MRQRAYRIGDAVVTRIPELLLHFAATNLLPNWDAAAARHGRLEQDSPDAGGHLAVSTHTWLVRTPRHTILVDTAVGNGKARATADFDRLEVPWLDRLAGAGVAPEQVDLVLMTHLHTDHVGWNTRHVDGRWVPTFPNARYLMSRVEQQRLERLVDRDGPTAPRTAFYADSVLPVIEAGQASYFDAVNGALPDGLTLHPTPGHSTDHMSIGLRSGGGYGLFAGDVMHDPLQLRRPDWSSVFSEDVERGRASREWVLRHAAETEALVFSSHFPAPSAGRVMCGAEGFEWTFA